MRISAFSPKADQPALDRRRVSPNLHNHKLKNEMWLSRETQIKKDKFSLITQSFYREVAIKVSDVSTSPRIGFH